MWTYPRQAEQPPRYGGRMAQGQGWGTKARIIQAGMAALVLGIALACSTPATPPAVGSPQGLGSSAPSSSVAAVPSAAPSGSSGGASLPCERSLDWGNPAPNEVCRDQGQLCSDMQKHVVFPICDKTILEKVVPLKTFEKRQSAPAGLAIRGYLRRHRLRKILLLMSTDKSEEKNAMAKELGNFEWKVNPQGSRVSMYFWEIQIFLMGLALVQEGLIFVVETVRLPAVFQT